MKLVVSNVEQKNEMLKNQMVNKLKKMKKEALDEFEASLEKKDNETNYSLYSSQILKNLIENAKITIEGLEIVFVYQVYFELSMYVKGWGGFLLMKL